MPVTRVAGQDDLQLRMPAIAGPQFMQGIDNLPKTSRGKIQAYKL